jgi:hypothetical protein
MNLATNKSINNFKRKSEISEKCYLENFILCLLKKNKKQFKKPTKKLTKRCSKNNNFKISFFVYCYIYMLYSLLFIIQFATIRIQFSLRFKVKTFTIINKQTKNCKKKKIFFHFFF